MPSVSAKQAHLFAAIAHGWKPSDPKLARIPIGVARDFNAADTGTSIRHDAQVKALDNMGRMSKGVT